MSLLSTAFKIIKWCYACNRRTKHFVRGMSSYECVECGEQNR